MSDKPSARYRFSVVRDRLRRHPSRYLDFVFGRHEIALPDAARQTVVGRAEMALRRCTADEVEAFARTAASYLSRTYGATVPESAILPTPGGRAALSTLAATLISPGQSVVVTEPGYPVFDRVAAQSHAVVRTVSLDPAREFELSLGSSSMEPARLLALNYPNNPTGSVPSSSVIASIQRHVDPETIWLNDATYGPLTYGVEPFSLLATDPVASGQVRGIELHSLAKLFPLGPLSASFLAGDEALVAEVREYSDFAYSPMSALQLLVAGECLAMEEHVAALRDALRKRLERLESVLRELGFESFPVHGGIYLLCRCPHRIGKLEVRTADEAAETLLVEHDLAVMPFQVGAQAYLRFSALYLDEELDALAGLGQGIPIVHS